MKKLNVIYLFLFILLVMGAFASMAQNSYGLKILGGVAFFFAFIISCRIRHSTEEKGKRRSVCDHGTTVSFHTFIHIRTQGILYTFQLCRNPLWCCGFDPGNYLPEKNDVSLPSFPAKE